MIGSVVWGIIVIALVDTPAGASDLRVQVEVFDWHSKKPPPKGISGSRTIPANAKPTVSFGVKATPGKPFAAEAIVASRKVQLSGIVQGAVEKAHVITVQFLLQNGEREEKQEISTTVKLSLNEPTSIGGSTSKSTRRGVDSYIHRVVQIRIAREELVK